MSQRLYTANEVGVMLGMSRHWVLEHCVHDAAPSPEYTMMRGNRSQPLWSGAGLDRWRAYAAGGASIPNHRKGAGYSDHNAVNRVGPVVVTWKLWWRNTYDGGHMWWLSTPIGWFVSNDDGRSWDFADVTVRPVDYHYYSINGNVIGAAAVVLRSAEKLRRRLEAAQCSPQ